MNEKNTSSIVSKYDRIAVVVRATSVEKPQFSAFEIPTTMLEGLADYECGERIAQLAIRKDLLKDPLAASDYRISSSDNIASIGVYGRSTQLAMALDRFSCNRELWNPFNKGFFNTLADAARIHN